MSIFKLVPACQDYIWGGTRLRAEYGKQSEAQVIAETWELSCHPSGLSRLEGSGKTLREQLAENTAAVGTSCASLHEFPILIKLIDAASALSVQVHPDDCYALEREGQYGKTEVWYVVDCAPGATLYYGVKQELTVQALAAAIEEGTLCEQLNEVAVKKGDVFFIGAGTIHAIGAGILIAEVQQSSDLTYRVYDYGRTDAQGNARALHIEKACEVAKLTPERERQEPNGHLAQCAHFTLDLVQLAGEAQLNADAHSFHSLLVLEGDVTVTWRGGVLHAGKGDSLFVEAGTGDFVLRGEGQILHTYR